MKPPPFAYVAPRSLDEVVATLASEGGSARVLAGGQSLVPLLNMRLAAPRVLVDLNRVPGLNGITERDGGVAIGAMARHRAVERDPLVARQVPLLAEAIRWVGHPQIRTRGTLGGTLAHADPAAEAPAVAVCLDARVTVRGPHGERTIGASDLYAGYLTTTLEPEEVLTEAWFPALPARSGQAWLEFARRHGDYAIVGVGVSLTLADDGAVHAARIALTGVGPIPPRAHDAEAILAGRHLDAALPDAVDAVRRALEPEADVHASAEYRRHLAGVLVERALRLAHKRARAAAAAPEPAALDIRRALEQMGRNA